MTASRTARPWRLAVLSITTLVVLGSLTAGTSPTSARSVDATPRDQPSASRILVTQPAAAPPDDSVSFPTVPPGAPLPTGQQCAEMVQQAPETIGANVPYNATRGRQRLPEDFFHPLSTDPRAASEIASRVDGAYTGTTAEILQWAACKWGIDEQILRAQTEVESSWRQTSVGDWTTNPDHCAPDHGIGVDGQPGQCPESWGIQQIRYRFYSGAFPDAIASTAFNLDAAYAVWRACFEGYEWWLRDVATPGYTYKAGDAWGCIGRWFSGGWYDEFARQYIDCVRRVVYGRPPCPER